MMKVRGQRTPEEMQALVDLILKRKRADMELTPNQLATRFGCSKTTVLEVLRANGLHTSAVPRPERRRAS